MNEQEHKLMEVMEHCVLNAEFCNDCPNKDEDYPGCRRTHEEFFAMVRRLLSERDALRADLALACDGNNPCLVCGHFRPELDGKCELMGWKCSWIWRGAKGAGA